MVDLTGGGSSCSRKKNQGVKIEKERGKKGVFSSNNLDDMPSKKKKTGRIGGST